VGYSQVSRVFVIGDSFFPLQHTLIRLYTLKTLPNTELLALKINRNILKRCYLSIQTRFTAIITEFIQYPCGLVASPTLSGPGVARRRSTAINDMRRHP
jgi:hypothetical protein